MTVRHAFAVLLLGFSASLSAIDSEPAFTDPVLQARYDRLTEEIRCLQCQNQPIADSNAGIAGDLRRQVKEMIAGGSTDREILDYVVERYGDFVLYRPPLAPRTWLLWGGPFLFLLIGVLIAVKVIAKKSRLVGDDDELEVDETAEAK